MSQLNNLKRILMWKTGRLFGLALLACSCQGAWGASIYTETFTSGAAGWTQSGSMQIAATDQTLQGLFAVQGVPIPQTGAYVVTNTSSGGAFTGDYDAAGIHLIGFSFMALDVVPSHASLRWQGPASSFFRSFASMVTTTGVWYRLAFSLKDKDAGSWSGGSSEEFAEGLLDVKGLEIQLGRTGEAAQRYYIDDVFVDGLPAGSIAGTTGGVQVLWSSLRPGFTYAVESADQPSDPWDPAGSFVATGASEIWPDLTATNRHRVYRLLFNESQ